MTSGRVVLYVKSAKMVGLRQGGKEKLTKSIPPSTHSSVHNSSDIKRCGHIGPLRLIASGSGSYR